MFYDKPILKTLLRDFGLLIHLPAVLSVPCFLVAVVYKEWIGLQAFAGMSVASICLGQLLYQPFKNATKSNPVSNILLIALIWLAIPLIGAFPFWYIGHFMHSPLPSVEVFREPANSLFEAMSGFTSTGLTMAKDPSQLPHTLQWWRSLCEWTGGSGILVLSFFLLDTQHENKSLYEAETRSWIYKGKVSYTVKYILILYGIFTLLSIGTFYLAGMPFWEALNHGLTAISTGGFSVNKNSFTDYSANIKIAAMAIMLLGAISFKIHFLLFKLGKWRAATQQTQMRYFMVLYIGGLAIAFLMAKQPTYMEVLFQWTSALATCGFSTVKLAGWPPSMLLLLVVAMCAGGNADSTTGGLKTERVAWLLKPLFWFVGKSWQKGSRPAITFNGEKIKPEETRQKLQQVNSILLLWIITMLVSTLLLSVIVEDRYSFQQIVFEVASALNSVGLSSGITGPELALPGKLLLILLMWMGRLEIFAVLILLCSPYLLLSRHKSIHEAAHLPATKQSPSKAVNMD